MKAQTRVLIVEDESVIALDLKDALEELGYVVVGMAASSAEAISKADEDHPDLVLMDIRIEGAVDGIESAALMRSRFQIPIIYLTANADPETLARALETEPDGYLAKPYNPRSLRSTIEVALRRHRTECDLREKNIELVHKRRLVEEHARELAELAERFRRESIVDPLTGLYNRRYLDSVLLAQIGLAQRENHSVGIVLLDLDHFKMVNDEFGHSAGDRVLQKVSEYLRARTRNYDVTCRYGGEEMVIVLPGSSITDTRNIAEKLRRGIESLSFAEGDRPISSITASFGVAGFPEHGVEPEELMRAADAALYRAKGEGRNRVVVAPMA